MNNMRRFGNYICRHSSLMRFGKNFVIKSTNRTIQFWPTAVAILKVFGHFFGTVDFAIFQKPEKLVTITRDHYIEKNLISNNNKDSFKTLRIVSKIKRVETTLLIDRKQPHSYIIFQFSFVLLKMSLLLVTNDLVIPNFDS